jgi:hypothetical protein
LEVSFVQSAFQADLSVKKDIRIPDTRVKNELKKASKIYVTECLESVITIIAPVKLAEAWASGSGGRTYGPAPIGARRIITIFCDHRNMSKRNQVRPPVVRNFTP